LNYETIARLGLEANETGRVCMAIIGYARVSTNDQDLTVQIEALKAAGCEPVRAEKVSGASTVGREQLATILAFIEQGDVLTVTRIDRLARSIGDLQDIVRALRAKGATLRAIEQPIDTSTAAGKAFLDMLGVFAEFETNLRKERQMEGIARAKAEGVYKGRKRSIDAEKIRALDAEGLGATEIANALGIGRASVYRLLGRDRVSGVVEKPDPLADLDLSPPASLEEVEEWFRKSKRELSRGAGPNTPGKNGALPASQRAIGGGSGEVAPKRDPLEDWPS
jgi:DNA invertase Pin-like site-specific DNA recombinase